MNRRIRAALCGTLPRGGEPALDDTTAKSQPAFDARRAHLQGADMFQRFRAPATGDPLARAGLPMDRFVLVFERGGEVRALDAEAMTYHHLAQGELAEKPYLVTF